MNINDHFDSWYEVHGVIGQHAFNDVYSWCLANIGMHGVAWTSVRRKGLKVYFFKKSEDVTLFILKFGGHCVRPLL